MMDFIEDLRYWKFTKNVLHHTIIDFYNPEEADYGYLANYYPSKICIAYKLYATVEHYYQAQKFTNDAELYEKVRTAPTPADAKSISRQFPEKVDPAWDSKKVDAMEVAVLEKFKQNPHLTSMLFQTDTAILRERIPDDAPTDTFWGWNPMVGGLNMAGKILMKVRMEIGGYDIFGICLVKNVPTRNGKQMTYAVSKEMQHMAIVVPPKDESKLPIVRLHSRCWTGDVFDSVKCDCRSQLWRGMEQIECNEGGGVLIYLDQEGRGLGIVTKIRGFNSQKHGFDTVQACQIQNAMPDVRDYGEAAEMLKRLGILQIRLITNNKAKEEGMAANGIKVVENIRMRVENYNINSQSRKYFETKVKKLGHHKHLLNGKNES